MSDVRTTETTPVATDFTSSEGTPIVIDESTNIPYYSLDGTPTPLQAIGGKQYVTTTAVLDFPNLAVNEVGVLTVTLTGVRENDPVMAGPPAGIETDYTWSVVCTADDTVEVRLHNNTGGASDPASATWRVSAFI